MTLDGCSMMSFNYFLAEQSSLENPRKNAGGELCPKVHEGGAQKVFERKNRSPIHLGISSGKPMALPSQKIAFFPGILTSGYLLAMLWAQVVVLLL